MHVRRAFGRVLLWLGIGTAVLVTLASMAIPRCACHRRPQANEAAAIATLKNIHAAQQQLLARKAIDCDEDGIGEAGTFAELAGAVPLRQARDVAAAPTTLSPPHLPPSFSRSERGRVHRGGYLFQLFLPAKDGSLVAQATAIDVDASERDYAVCAWPDGRDALIRRAFWLDGKGQIWSCPNLHHRYLGHAQPMPADAAMPTTAAGSKASREATSGRDGQLWQMVH